MATKEEIENILRNVLKEEMAALKVETNIKINSVKKETSDLKD